MNYLDSKQIAWRCRRGMLELDLILQRFCHEHFDLLSEHLKLSFLEILEAADTDLYQWLIGYNHPPEEFTAIVHVIQKSQQL